MKSLYYTLLISQKFPFWIPETTTEVSGETPKTTEAPETPETSPGKFPYFFISTAGALSGLGFSIADTAGICKTKRQINSAVAAAAGGAPPP